MSGMDARTGRRLDEDAHIRQSVTDILITHLGSRVKRRPYGSVIPDLIDHPASPANRLRLYAASLIAVMRWEPRVTIVGARISIDTGGTVVVDIYAIKRRGPRAGVAITLSIPLR